MLLAEIEFNTIKDKVRHILKLYPSTRSSDKVLFFYYLREFSVFRVINIEKTKEALKKNKAKLLASFDIDEKINVIMEIIEDQIYEVEKGANEFPNFRTIVRCRAQIQNEDGEFLPDNETIEMRKQRDKDYKKFITRREEQEEYEEELGSSYFG